MAKQKKSIKKTRKKKLVSTVLELGEKIKRLEKEELKKEKIPAFKAVLSGEHVVSKDKKAIDLYGASHFGEIKDKKVYYSLIEALYLVERKKLNLYFKGKKLTFEKFFDMASHMEPNFFTRFSVFKDIRNRGYIIKTALKFGADFRVYDRGIRPGQDHAKWVLFPVYETSSLTWHEFAAKNRVAHSTRKNLLIAIVDEEGDVTYYEIKWTRP